MHTDKFARHIELVTLHLSGPSPGDELAEEADFVAERRVTGVSQLTAASVPVCGAPLLSTRRFRPS